MNICLSVLSCNLKKAEIAPSYKFKLAVNRGLPYLIPHGLSGELLPRRCTITVLPFRLCNRDCFVPFTFASVTTAAIKGLTIFIAQRSGNRFAQLPSFLWHCPHPHGHLGFPSRFAIWTARTFLIPWH